MQQNPASIPRAFHLRGPEARGNFDFCEAQHTVWRLTLMLLRVARCVMARSGPSPVVPADRSGEERSMMRSLGSILMLVLAAGVGARADTRQAQFLVQVTVPARASLVAAEQPAHLSVSEEDLVRGYKDVSARYVVESNARQGWLLQLSPRLGITQHIEVRGLSGTVLVRDEGVEVFRPRTREPERLELHYRLVLAPDARPGTYDMPVHVAATPL